jgi:hypothetical protein
MVPNFVVTMYVQRFDKPFLARFLEGLKVETTKPLLA